MRWLRFAVLILLFTFIQGSNLPQLLKLEIGATPDFLLILLAFFAIRADGREAVVTSFAIGIAADIISPYMGPHIIAFGLFGTVLNNLKKLIIVQRMSHNVVAVLAVGIAAQTFSELLAIFQSHISFSQIVFDSFGTAVYSALLAPYIFSLLVTISGWLGLKRYHFMHVTDR